MARRRGRRRKKLLDDLKDRRGYSHLKEEALDRTIWKHRFGGGFGPVVRQNTEWMNIYIHTLYRIYIYIYIYIYTHTHTHIKTFVSTYLLPICKFGVSYYRFSMSFTSHGQHLWLNHFYTHKNLISSILYIFLPIFVVFVHNFDTVTDQDIINPTNFMKFYINFVLHKLYKSYGTP